MLGAFTLLLAAAMSAGQAAPLQRQTISLALANGRATTAIAPCRAIGREAVVAVVDRGGNLVALQRGDDIGPHNS